MAKVLGNLKRRLIMSVFSKRNLLVGIATLAIGIGTSAAIWGMPNFLKRNTTIKSQVTAFLLDDRGAVNGLLLASGDQLHFSKETGAAVATQMKVGDEVTVIGHAGSQSSYGREVRVEQISANGRTIVEAGGPPRPHGPREKRGHGKHDGREARENGPDGPGAVGSEPGEKTASAAPNSGPANDSNNQKMENALPAPAAEVIKATGTIRTHLVNGHGDVHGLILSSGEQVRFSPKVGKLVVAAEQGATTQLNVEGTVVRTDQGIVIRPTYITVGNQTISLGH
jgi:hypothetical protein